MSPLAAHKHIDAIRSALWHGTPFGRAAVMIGSGFSLNARPTSLTARRFPLWKELTAHLYARLNPDSRSDQEPHKEALIRVAATSEALRLAEGFQSSFGRPQLEDLLLELIPDKDHEPGDLHRKLLQLPWADVLTTNYDTLLERAAREVYERRYDVVRTVSDIPRASRPRIVKLHGSFPSHRPFIITEEDFRTYPRVFTGFVNLAQQTAMESVLCLLGFSGDDPNFLQWTGWVRDHLGASSPRIYLCGLLNLNESDLPLLDRRNVTPVDLRPLFPESQFPDAGVRHRLAAEWFLLNLERGRPYHPRSWPQPSRALTPVSEGLPPMLPDPRRHPVKEEMFRLESNKKEALVDAVRVWRHNRELYPGWVFPPESVRDRLWHVTSYWAAWTVTRFLPEFDPCTQLEILSEMTWRLDACLCPVWPQFVPPIQTCLRTINPYPDRLTDWPDAKLVLGRDDLQGYGWADVRERWFRLSVALARFYREERRADEFRETVGRLEQLAGLHPDQIARLRYEKSLFALEHLDDESAHAELRIWPSDTSDPMWEIRRAALIAELGDPNQAEAIASAALTRLRTESGHHLDRVPELSREGWAIVLLNGISFHRDHGIGDERARQADRLRELEPFGCDPWGLLAAFDTVQPESAPKEKRQGEEKFGFQPKQVTVSYSSGLGDKLLPAYQLIRLGEEAGYPPQCGNVKLNADRLMAAAEWCLNYDPVRTQSVMCRLLDDKLLKRYLTRPRVAALPIETVNRFAEESLRAIRAALAAPVSMDYRSDNLLGHRLRDRLETAIGILGRVLIRLPQDQIATLWPLAFELYSSAFARGSLGLPDEVKDLFASLIAASDRTTLESHFTALFALPIPGTTEFQVPMSDRWPDFGEQLQERIGSLKSKPTGPEWDQVKSRLLTVAETGEDRPKHLAVSRLLRVRDLGCLTRSESKRLATLVWKSADPETGLPRLGPFYNWVWLTIPPPTGASPVKRFRDYALGWRQPGAGTGELTDGLLIDWLNASRQNSRLEPDEHRRHINWTARDAAKMLDRIVTWWKQKGRNELLELREPKSMAAASWGGAFAVRGVTKLLDRIILVLRWVVIPTVLRNPKVGQNVIRLVDDFEVNGVAVGVIVPSLALIDPNADTAGRLRGLLARPDERSFVSALRGLLDWVSNQRKRGEPNDGTRLPPPPGDLIHELGYLVESRRWPGLDQALGAVAVVLEKLTGKADDIFIRSVLIGLEHLLTETEYREREDQEGSVPCDQIPRCRQRAARVAVQLARHGQRNHPTVKKWLEAIRVDPLPEVRFAGSDE